MDPNPESAPLVLTGGTAFNPRGTVTRQEAAYALTQATGRAAIASSYDTEAMFAFDEDGNAVPLADAAAIDPPYRGHVQDAIVRGIVPVRFSVDGSQAFVDPRAELSRADWAVMAVRTFGVVEFDG